MLEKRENHEKLHKAIIKKMIQHLTEVVHPF